MLKLNHTCKFSALTISFSEMWPRQILELGKQFNLMIRNMIQNILKAPLQDVVKMYWRRLEDVLKTSWRRLENVLKTFLQTSWRRVEDVLKISWQEVLKMSWRRHHCKSVFKTSSSFCKTFWKRLEDVLKTYGQDEYIGLDQDVFWRQRTKANIFVLIKTSWRCLQDVFIKTYVCWEWYQITQSITNILVDTGRKLNVHKTLRRRPRRLLNVLRTFNLRPMSAGML